ncbi:daf-9 isoform A [Aspergillus flavus]|uniref:Daf-9 isoform A n=1 Tax=Aspergillus flavus TaxID=5059 RepID=A0AB74BUR4_ASPFL|nr:daf-9 isoform A [Aspergillus flavus]
MAYDNLLLHWWKRNQSINESPPLPLSRIAGCEFGILNSFLALLILRVIYEYYRDRRLPPGPRRLPLIGNIHQVPQVLPWRTFHQWSKKYIRAVVEESLRWRSIVPGGVPHAARKDDTYMSYHIPKGATTVPLHWSMSLDEQHFDNPLEFRPERWLAGPDDDRFTNFFGYGRRICPRRHIARNSLFILVARVLWGFEVRPPTGPDGQPKTVDLHLYPHQRRLKQSLSRAVRMLAGL